MVKRTHCDRVGQIKQLATLQQKPFLEAGKIIFVGAGVVYPLPLYAATSSYLQKRLTGPSL